MTPSRQDLWRAAAIVGLASLTLAIGLGRSARLTYHEAFVAQASREMLASGELVVPTVGGQPWLEKPPLAIWLGTLCARLGGGVGEASARIPSALAATVLALTVAAFAARRFGPTIGLLAGLIQTTTVWTVSRGRLAEADMLLAALVAMTLVAFDRLRGGRPSDRLWPMRLAFFVGLGLTALVKGIGFGGALIVTVVTVVLVWDRDWQAFRKLRDWRGWILTLAVAAAWPLAVLWQYPAALNLWTLHVADRFAEHPTHFTGGPWWSYGPDLLWQTLPWTFLALAAAPRSLARAVRERGLGDRLLWAWAVAPVALLNLATVKNAHYAIHALPPWSIWSALGMARLAVRLRARGWPVARLRRAVWLGFGSLGLACALGFTLLGPQLDRRGVEWAFYEMAGRTLKPNEPLVLLYDDWDRTPYVTPFGPVPHDLAVRLFYLDRPTSWRESPQALAEAPPARGQSPFAVIGRDRDLPTLRRLGAVETVLRGPQLRAHASHVDDRSFVLFRINPSSNQVVVGWKR
jgi:4-amino-4-deoxy-L-arabinose transferase-like glycosyltransferase